MLQTIQKGQIKKKTIECLRNEIFFSVDFSMDFLEPEEIIFNPWIEYPWIAVYFIDPWMKSGYKWSHTKPAPNGRRIILKIIASLIVSAIYFFLV